MLDERQVDLNDPDTFFNDINNVTGVLKQYLRSLPEPVLMTSMQEDWERADRIHLFAM